MMFYVVWIERDEDRYCDKISIFECKAARIHEERVISRTTII